MTSSAPSSIFLRPIFQASATRMEYCSMVSGCVVGTISTAIWLPLRCSKLLIRWFSVSMVSLASVLVRSTTCPLSGGTATSASATCAKHNRSASSAALIVLIPIEWRLAIAPRSPRPACGERSHRIARCDAGEGELPRVHLPPCSRRQPLTPTLSPQAGRGSPPPSRQQFKLISPSLIRLLRWRRIEIDLRRSRDFLLVVDGKIRLLLVAESHGGQIVREGADADIIVLHRLDVAVARHGDAVLGTFELRHQIAKQRVRFELRIILGHDQ